MKTEQESISFHTHESHPEIKAVVEKKYPPNNQQRRICEYLNVPTSLWSFYESKYTKIKEKWFINLCSMSKGRINEEHSEKQLLAYAKNCERYVQQFTNSHFPNMTFEEKFFYLNTNFIKRCLQDTIFMLFNPLRLQDECMNTLLLSMNPNRIDKLKLFLPKGIFQNLLNRIPTPMPTYDSEKMQFHNFPINNQFSKVDTIFPKEFVVFFQNTENIGMNYISPLFLVHFVYFTNNENIGIKQEDLCTYCMKKDLETNKTKILERRIFHYDELNFENPTYSEIRYYYNILFNHMQAPAHWCHKCKQVPLFQLLKEETFKDQYTRIGGEKNFPLKNESFI